MATGGDGDDLLGDDYWVAGDGSESGDDAGVPAFLATTSDQGSGTRKRDDAQVQGATKQKKKGGAARPSPAASLLRAQPGAEFAKQFWRLYAEQFELAELEQEEYVRSSTPAFPPLPSLPVPRTLPHLSEYLQACEVGQDVMRPPTHSDEPGSPYVLLLVPSSLRAIAVFKALRDLNAACRIALLFPKHKKVSEHVQLLQRTVTRLAIATPQRAHKLVEEKALSTLLGHVWRETEGYGVADTCVCRAGEGEAGLAGRVAEPEQGMEHAGLSRRAG